MLERFNHERDRELRSFARLIEGKARGHSQPWVAELKGLCAQFGFKRDFLSSQLDFAEANSAGSRGVRACYILESGHVYEVFSKTSWKRSHRYFVTVTDDGEIRELSKDDAETLIIHGEIDSKWHHGNGI